MRSGRRPTMRESALSVEKPPKHETTKHNGLSCFRDFVAYAMSVRIAVIGVGHLGRHHARILSTLDGVELAAVVDTNRIRAEEIAAACRTRAYHDWRDIVGLVDAVTL